MTTSPTKCTVCSNQDGGGILMLTEHPDYGPAEIYVGLDCCFWQMARDAGFVPEKELRHTRGKNRELRAELKSTQGKLMTATGQAVNEFLETVREGMPNAPKPTEKKDPVGAITTKEHPHGTR